MWMKLVQEQARGLPPWDADVRAFGACVVCVVEYMCIWGRLSKEFGSLSWWHRLDNGCAKRSPLRCRFEWGDLESRPPFRSQFSLRVGSMVLRYYNKCCLYLLCFYDLVFVMYFWDLQQKLRPPQW